MGKFGYIGARPTQSDSSSSGVFSVNDVANALDQGIYPLQVLTVSYLVVAGGGGSGLYGPGPIGAGGAGGGGDGARNTPPSAAGNGATNTGGGAGGAGPNPGTSPNALAGTGGSGIVMIRYKFQ